MQARFPQDVDLEDRVILGLTPIRFGYLAVAALGSFCAWSIDWGCPWGRAAAGIPPLLVGLALAWGRLHGRPLDCWIADMAVFATRMIAARGRLLSQQPELGDTPDTRNL
ncbi:MAG TPA: PrgI family protein [Candidatus Dormibacteraeota bacterium]|jgi:hypothetical protein|nr:PrgI family protein [Candidatus Dormibacteraeota bacterium]